MLKALRVNLLPGLILQSFMAVMGAAYLWHPIARHAFAELAILRTSWGLLFSFIGTSFAATFIPEILSLLLIPNANKNWAIAAKKFWRRARQRRVPGGTE